MNKNLIKKPWGSEQIIHTNKHYTLKKLVMISQSRCSLQYHKRKIETIFVLAGPLYILVGKTVNSLKTISTCYCSNVSNNYKKPADVSEALSIKVTLSFSLTIPSRKSLQVTPPLQFGVKAFVKPAICSSIL